MGASHVSHYMDLAPIGEAALVAGLGLFGYWTGRWCAGLPRPYWTLGYFLPLTIVFVLWLGRFHDFELTAPMSWLLVGRMEFALAAPIVTLLLSTPLSRLQRPQTRRLVVLFMILLAGMSGVWPFLAPALNRGELTRLPTRFDPDGVCLQSTDYTCGPAAAVTVLQSLGLSAREGELALLARTSRGTGTPPDLLRDALADRYGRDGLICEYRHFHSLAELREALPAVVVMKFTLLVDHYVAILKIDDEEVVIGDPLTGVRRLNPAEFSRQWRRSGLVLRRPSTSSWPNSRAQ